MSNLLKRQILKRVKLIELEVNDNKLIKNHLPKTLLSIDKVIDIPRKNGKIIKQVICTYYSNIHYNDLVKGMIRERYTIEDELCIQRKYKKGINEVEFNEYDSFVEECKMKAREFIAERERVVNENDSR